MIRTNVLRSSARLVPMLSIMEDVSMESGAVRTTGLAELIAALWRRGVPVVGWAEVRDGIVLLADGGASVLVPRGRLGEQTDTVAWSVALQLPRRRILETPASPLLVPQFSERELAWLRFLRWLRERELGAGFRTA